MVRNCFFEPSLTKNFKVEDTLKEIEISFRWKKPAIICSHRLNYIGYLDKKNRDRNLEYLNNLLNTILVRWPEVEFMTSVELGEIIEKSKIQ